MSSARRGESTTDDAMAADMHWQSSGQRSSSDDDGEAAEFSPSLYQKEMRGREYDDDDDDSAYYQSGSEGPPDLVDSSDDDDDDNQDRQDFLRESAELFESDGDKKSKQRLADFTKSELLQRLMELEKEEQAQKYHESRPGSVRSFQREFHEDKVVRDMLRDQSTSRKRSFRAAMSPPQRKPLQNDASASDSDRESTATDSMKWVSVVRVSHKEHMQPEIESYLV
jgi:hypothetical protein